MPDSVTFTAWNLDPAFSAGPVGQPPGWVWQGMGDSTRWQQAGGNAIDLSNHLISVEIRDADGDGFVRPSPADTVIINGVTSSVMAVWVGDSMTIDGVAYRVVTFYTSDGNAFALPFSPSTDTLVAAFGGSLTGTEFIYQSSQIALAFDDLQDLPELCLMQGTRVATAAGPVEVQNLRPGDLVQTVWNGLQPLRWIARVKLRAAPVVIGADALGPGLPGRDLVLSAQHRVLVGRVGVVLGLAPAQALCRLARIRRAPGKLRTNAPPGLFHLLFDRHEVILAEGLAVESLLLAPGALEGMTQQDRAAAFAALGRAVPSHLGREAGGFGIWSDRMVPAAPVLTPRALSRFKPREIHGFGAGAPPAAPENPCKPAGNRTARRAPDADVLAIPLKHW